MTQRIINMANKQTPDSLVISNQWVALASLLLGKWGVGAVFMFITYFLYLDLRESYRQFSNLVEANTAALNAFAAQVQAGHNRVESMKETVNRIVGNTEELLRARRPSPPES